MATLALSALGSAVGNALLPAGFGSLGSQIGAFAGSQIDQALFGGSGRGRVVDGPRLSDLTVTTSTEGAHIPRLYGRARLGGQIIWATALDEEAVDRNAAGRGKGTRAGAAAAGSDYLYFANFAVALCEGEITALGRMWADGREVDMSDVTYRLYTGSETQAPDPLIAAKHDGCAPAYLGLAYIVFDHLPLAAFGNRIPQLSFEVSRAVDALERDLKGVVLIPGSGEFVYAQEPVERRVSRISSTSENTHTLLGGTDWSVSLDQLQTHLPNANSVSLVVAWFGDDLAVDRCSVRPRVEVADKITTPATWSVAGVARASADVVSQVDGRAAYGGTPSDRSVIGAIRDLKNRGLSVVLSPFLLMDIAAGNTKHDPYSSAASQPAHPWRGRLTVAPAAGRPGTPDTTALAAAHIASFVGAAQVAYFSIVDDTVVYSGPDEWSFRRFILHHAHLAKAAGGVDAFVLCSELRGLTRVRAQSNTFPFVAALVQLAADVRAVLGLGTKILYAADWTEYQGYRPADGSGDVFFNLDALWASPHVDCIGIDVYWPLSDWRDGTAHLDAVAGAWAAHDLTYLKNNLAAGEDYDWFYASDAARVAQVRTPITDGLGKPWIHRTKDMQSWWSNAHFDRHAGVEIPAPTNWLPQSKPIWLMEIGCPAVDKGANQPNVFVDPKSSESLVPHFSNGARDDLMQRRVLQAYSQAFDPSNPGFVPALNPVSSVYGARMVDHRRMHVYCWDARPYPAFPTHTEIWSDGNNWRLGHWINGRTASAPVAALVATLLVDFGFTDFDASHLLGTAEGLVVDRIMSARQALQPLEIGFFFDTLETDGQIVFRPRGSVATGIVVASSDCVETRADRALLQLTRSQETDLPASSKVTYIAAAADYEQASSEARRIGGASGRTSQAALGLVLDTGEGDAIAERLLFEAWSSRERALFTLPPSRLALEPGDTLEVTANGRSQTFRITEISDHGAREIEARSIDANIYTLQSNPPRAPPAPISTAGGPPLLVYIDCPPLESDPPHAPLIAAAQDPWPGDIAVFRSPENSGFTLSTVVTRAATTGIMDAPLSPGVVGRMDRASSLVVTVDRGSLISVSSLALLAGANTAAVEITPGVWEIVQFQTSTLIGPLSYRLSDLLRYQRGTEHALSISTGARFVLLDDAVRPLAMTYEDVGLPLVWRAGPAGKAIGDPAYTSTRQTFRGTGLTPLAPVHLGGARNLAGDLAISWIRRTRSGGDSWLGSDVPLGEASESYVIDILSLGSVVRSLSSITPTATYTAAAQISDFGSVQSSVSLRLSQLAPSFGRGSTRVMTF